MYSEAGIFLVSPPCERKGQVNAKVLVVEDNEDNRTLVVKVLTHAGYEVVEAASGEDALLLTEEELPDIVLMDLNLSGITGYEATRRLKENPRLKNIPVVALTAYAMAGDMESALASGCDGYISKPVDIRKLPEQVRTYIKERGK